ncbi:MAG TPA: DinB family protein [Acidimicrobiales bacterium]|nr:DinB family protein [Acidimicrobiales bacterium]
MHTTDPETRDLLDTLGKHRGLLRATARKLDDRQAVQRTTVSDLTIAGIIKHVTATEDRWVAFIHDGARAFPPVDASAAERQAETFRVGPEETLAGVLDAYAAAAQRTDALVESLPSLNAAHPLPEAPWFPPGTAWSARRVVLHLIAETAQHAGHADIIREALDGRKTMG